MKPASSLFGTYLFVVAQFAMTVHAFTVSNTYDSLNRLASANYENGTTITYTYDAAGNRLSLVSTNNSMQPDHIAPVLQISLPTTDRLFVTTSNAVTLAGTASDNNAVTSLNWTNNFGLQGIPSGTGSWTFGPVPLSNAITKITVSASDAATNIARASLTVVRLPPSSSSNVVFQDNFDDNSIDVTKWTNWGNSVVESGQIMQVLQSVTDAGGNLKSLPFVIGSTGVITVTRNVKLHYSQNYFIAETRLLFASLPPVLIKYGNMVYNTPPQKAVQGFYVCRNDANPHDVSHNTNDVSSWISPLWDTWFKETISYNPQSGNLDYSMNDVLKTTFNVGIMPQTNSPKLVLQFNSWGWFTGYEHVFDNLFVSQSVPELSPDLILRDTDGDRIPDWAEILAGTSYTNANSFLSVGAISPMAITNTAFLVQWASVTGTLYSVNRATNLLAIDTFEPLKTNIAGLPGTTQYNDTNAPSAGASFYHISVDF